MLLDHSTLLLDGAKSVFTGSLMLWKVISEIDSRSGKCHFALVLLCIGRVFKGLHNTRGVVKTHERA